VGRGCRGHDFDGVIRDPAGKTGHAASIGPGFDAGFRVG
jgi:hypothetical protein